MKKCAIKGVYKDIYVQAKMPFEADSILPNKGNLSDWVYLLKAAIKVYKTDSVKMRRNIQRGKAGCYLIKPFIVVSQRELKRQINEIYLGLGGACASKLELQLESNLVNIVTNLVNSFSSSPGVESYNKQNDDEDSGLLFYIHKVYEMPLEFFGKFPVLSRLLSMEALNWINNTKVLLERYVKDFSEISRLCNYGECHVSGNGVIKTIKDVETGLSDPHECAQTVAIITLNNNKKIVYKPKNIDTEVYFNDFIGWLNNLSHKEDQLHVLKAIAKRSYGWVEYVDNDTECSSEKDIRSYYKKLGSLSAVLYVLRGTDYHHDNLISSGKVPYFIDHEMLCYPIYKYSNTEVMRENAVDIQDNYHESVLNTRIYPINEKRVNGSVMDISAIGYYDEGKMNPHLPKLDNEYKRYYKHVDSLIDGFKCAYSAISDNKQYLIDSPNSPLQKFKNVHVRFNARATSSYLSIIKRCIVPGALLNGKAFCDYMHSIRTKYPTVFQSQYPRDMELDELKILSRLDVPRFTIMSDSIALDNLSGGKYRPIFDLSGFQLVVDRINSLNEENMDKQVAYIADSFQ